MILPICKPSITSYLYHANYLSVLELNADAKHYLANSFLQLHTRENSVPGMLIIDFYSYEGKRPRYPLITKATVTAKTLRSMSTNVIEQACGAIDSGSYVEATLDEFHIESKLSYQTRHLPHESLIYGYSREENVFYAQGFTRDLNFKKFTISFAAFSTGFTEDMWLSIITPIDSIDNNSQRFSPMLVKTYLRDFIENKCSFPSYHPPRSVFGSATYAAAIERMEQYNGAKIDIRPWCIFYEHKVKLLSLHDYLVGEQSLNFSKQMHSELKLLASDFLRLRNYLLEASLSDSMIKLEKLSDNIGRITIMEKELIHEFINTI